MKILIDDEKLTLPNGSVPDIIVRNFEAAYDLLKVLADTGSLPACDLYLDHDLGDEDDRKNGYKLACIIEENVVEGEKWQWYPCSMTCVSANIPGGNRIRQVIEKLYIGET